MIWNRIFLIVPDFNRKCIDKSNSIQIQLQNGNQICNRIFSIKFNRLGENLIREIP